LNRFLAPVDDKVQSTVRVCVECFNWKNSHGRRSKLTLVEFSPDSQPTTLFRTLRHANASEGFDAFLNSMSHSGLRLWCVCHTFLNSMSQFVTVLSQFVTNVTTPRDFRYLVDSRLQGRFRFGTSFFWEQTVEQTVRVCKRSKNGPNTNPFFRSCVLSV